MKPVLFIFFGLYLLVFPVYTYAGGNDTLWTRQVNPHLLSCNSVAFNSNGTRLLTASDCHPAYCRLFDLPSGNLGWEFTDTSLMCFMDLRFSPNGQYFAIMEEFGQLILFDYSGASPVKKSQINTKSGASLSLSFSTDNSKVISSGFDDSIRVFSISSGKQLLSFGTHFNIYSICISADGSKIATGGQDGKIKVWNSSNGALLKTISAHSGVIKCVRFSPDGYYLLSSGTDDKLNIWKSADWSLEKTLGDHQADVTAFDISKDMQFLASASSDSTIILRSWGNWQIKASLKTPVTGRLNTVQFSPDARYLAAGGGTGYAALWDVSSTTVNREETPEKSTFRIYPNPATQELSIRFNAPVTEEIHIKLLEQSGRVLLSEQYPAKAGEQHIPFDLQGVKTGCYYVQIQSNTFQQIQKLIIF